MASAISVGMRVDYQSSSDVAVGTIILMGDLIGLADRPIPANRPGSLAIAGVFRVPKATGASTALTKGVLVYWDNTNTRATTTAGSNKVLGKVANAVADADANVDVIVWP